VSHGFSFVANYLGGERLSAKLPELMLQPYRRVLVLHLALIVGGFLLIGLGMPTGGLLMLVALKIALDIHAHLREREQLATER
jgi:hypothetical protein